MDLFATSGGAVNALRLVETHPDDVRRLVAHEPPTAALVPDRDRVLAETERALAERSAAIAGAGFAPQVADVPGRNEPGTGEIGWEHVFGRTAELGYRGWIGCEYRPLGDTAEGLAWRRRYGV